MIWKPSSAAASRSCPRKEGSPLGTARMVPNRRRSACIAVASPVPLSPAQVVKSGATLITLGSG